MRARVFLRQSLFAIPGNDNGHVPVNAAILVGTLTDQSGLGVTIDVESYADERGRPLAGPGRKLIVPTAKIDHIWIEG